MLAWNRNEELRPMNQLKITGWYYPGDVTCVVPVDGAEMNTVRFAREKLGFDPDPKQEMVLDEKIRRGMLNCTRQWGKSTVMAIKALYQAVYHPGTLTLVISPGERQSALLV